MSNSQLPPLASDGVLAVTGSSIIDAPRDKVWSILMDFKSYKEWNSFVREQNITDASKQILPEQNPIEGKYLTIGVNLPPTMDKPGLFGTGSAFVTITVVDKENYRAAWKTAGMPGFLLRTERWQSLTVDETTGKTRYDTIEVFNGIFAYLVKIFVGSKLSLGFQAMADDLKKRAEQN
ncbi:hypothetical protein BDQ12DRAFT_685127 [Crucibulum laeve]|uniref:Polyketide cyclase/dehydrase n=1 Tax=Crucibulum laeve TaxID=68775 RepID=A0A5C3LXP8_9AGAR|nr:hypothetical protein BDQ12DRAFT_685127 [Crucibulum laeve]